MAISFQRVQPGDLITADLMNQIMAAIEALDARSTGGTTTGGLMITNILPSGTVTVGDTIQIIGTGFGNTPALNLVSIGGVAVNVQAGTDTLMLVTVPNTPGSVSVTVSNSKGTTSYPLTVKSKTAVQAQMLVSNTGGPSDPKILAGSTYAYQFTATIFTNKDETFLFTPSVDLGWTAVATPTSQLVSKTTTNAGTPVVVTVNVTVPNGTADLTKATLKLTTSPQSDPTQKNSGTAAITVGSKAAQPTNKFSVAFSTTDGSASVANDGVVELPKSGAVGELDFQATFTAQAQGNNTQYDVTAALDDATGWTIVQTNPANFKVATVPGSFPGVAIQLKASNTAKPTNLNVTVTLHTDSTTFNLGSQAIRPV